MDEDAEWDKVDEYMVTGGFFDKASVGDLESKMAEFAGKDCKLVANACKWVIDAKKKGNYDLQQQEIRQYSQNDVPFAMHDEKFILYFKNYWSDDPRNWFLAAYVACASATARKKREAEHKKAVTKGYLPSIPEAHFELMRACLGRM